MSFYLNHSLDYNFPNLCGFFCFFINFYPILLLFVFLLLLYASSYYQYVLKPQNFINKYILAIVCFYTLTLRLNLNFQALIQSLDILVISFVYSNLTTLI